MLKNASELSETIEGVSLEVSVDPAAVSAACSSVTKCPTDATMATAPSSRHPSPPPSPQMATEPNYVKIDKPNSAALLNDQAAKVQEPVTRKSSLKSSTNSSSVENSYKYKPYVTLPILRNSESYDRHKYYEKSEVETEKNKASDGPKKKTVTFSVNLVQYYANSRYKSSKHSSKNSIFRTSKVHKPSIMSIRNSILTGRRS